VKLCPSHCIRIAVIAVAVGLSLSAPAQHSSRPRFGWNWQRAIPREFAAANTAAHPAAFKLKHFAFQTTGKVNDFFREMGRPDLFSHQGFTSAHDVVPHVAGLPLYGSFKYQYRNGFELYMHTSKMEWVDLALLYKNGKLLRLMYK
jgi:hypothetical protein